MKLGNRREVLIAVAILLGGACTKRDLPVLAPALPTATPAYEPDSGLQSILFASDRGAALQIYKMTPDGIVSPSLTPLGGYNGWPRWSPDRSKIAYCSKPDWPSIYQIWIMNSDGSGKTQITSVADNAFRPMWAPDGTKLVFATQDSIGYESIYTVNSDGSGLALLKAMASEASWSPDGTKIAYVDRNDSELYKMNVDGSNSIRLTFYDQPPYNTKRPRFPSWSPNGSKIAFEDYEILCCFGDGPENTIRVMNSDGSGVIYLTDLTTASSTPSWSPDGTKIVYETTDGGGDIYLMNADGTGKVRLTTWAGSDTTPGWGTY